MIGAILLVLAAAAGTAKPAATPDPRLQPIDVKAAHSVLELRGAHRHATLTGSVVARQGDLTLRAPNVEAVYAPGAAGVERIIADHGVEVTQGSRVAKADRAEFDNARHAIVLTGEPRVWDGDNLVQGSRIVLHVDDQRVECFDCSADIDPDTAKSLRPRPGFRCEPSEPCAAGKRPDGT